MITKIGNVTALEWVDGKKSKYVKATINVEGKDVNQVFFPPHAAVVAEAYKNKTWITYDIEKKDGDQYWNIVKVTPMAQVVEEANPPPKVSAAIATGTVATRQLSATDVIKNRSVALSYAKDMAIAGLIDKSPQGVVAVAEEFYGWMMG